MTAVLGSIFAGVASPTEAAAVGAFGATLLTVVRGRFNYSMLTQVMASTTKITSMVFIILVGARAFGLVFIEMGGNADIARFITEANLSGRQFLILVMVVVFIAGFFIDFIEITFIVVPVVAPILEAKGVNLTWFGILMAVNLQTSFLTPPFGFSLFYLKGVAPTTVSTGQIYRGIIPYVTMQALCLALVMLVPDAALWLPRTVSP
jgi:tripartite ATP-independent transporter DctM subunit